MNRSSIPATLWQILEDSTPFCTEEAMHPKQMQKHCIETKDLGVCTSTTFDYLRDPEMIWPLLNLFIPSLLTLPQTILQQNDLLAVPEKDQALTSKTWPYFLCLECVFFTHLCWLPPSEINVPQEVILSSLAKTKLDAPQNPVLIRPSEH